MTIEKLKSLGISDEIIDNSMDFLTSTVSEAETYIKNFCNISKVPEELYYDCANCACGKYLTAMKSFGKLDDILDFENTISAIKEGDVSVNFQSGTTAEQQFLSIISNWSNPDPSSLLRFRRLVW